MAPPSTHLSGRRYDVRDASDIAATSLAVLKLPYQLSRYSGSAELARRLPALVLGDYEALVRTLASAVEGTAITRCFGALAGCSIRACPSSRLN